MIYKNVAHTSHSDIIIPKFKNKITSLTLHTEQATTTTISPES